MKNNANPNRHERLEEALREAAAEFLSREANRNNLLTVTRVMLREDNKYATVYITVLPETGEQAAVDFANRNIIEFKDFFMTRVRGAFPPNVTFEIDLGEKNRQRLDELSN
jgi:ribosome-binding factor A